MIATLLTAGLCGLIFFVLSWRVVQVRQSAKVLLGDAGNVLLLGRIRAHANFAEYVPICLILLGAIEAASRPEHHPILMGVGITLVVVRISHAIGMTYETVNVFRIIGAAGTWLILVGLSIRAVMLALS